MPMSNALFPIQEHLYRQHVLYEIANDNDDSGDDYDDDQIIIMTTINGDISFLDFFQPLFCLLSTFHEKKLNSIIFWENNIFRTTFLFQFLEQ